VFDVDPGFGPDGSTKATTYMVNGYVDIPTYSYSGVVPYIGAGGRQGSIRAGYPGQRAARLAHSNAHAFAYQVIGGVEIPIIPRQMSTNPGITATPRDDATACSRIRAAFSITPTTTVTRFLVGAALGFLISDFPRVSEGRRCIPARGRRCKRG